MADAEFEHDVVGADVRREFIGAQTGDPIERGGRNAALDLVIVAAGFALVVLGRGVRHGGIFLE